MKFEWQQGFLPSRQTAAGIRMIRPLLILLMTLAHLFIFNQLVWMDSAAALGADNWLTVFLKAGLAKSGVPLLSLISGYLAVVSLERYGFGKLLLSKARRLLWPLFWWNLFFIILITYPAQAQDASVRGDLQVYPFSAVGWLQACFAYYRLPANEPLFFLKDLYTCFLLLPLLLAVSRVRYLNLAVVCWMAWKCIYLKSAFFFEVYPLWFMRFDIVFAFYIGILLNAWRKELVITHIGINIGLVALFLLVTSLASAGYVVLARPDHLELFLWTDFIVKVCSVAGCIAIMSLLVSHRGKLSRLLEWLSPFSYMIFLSHAITFTLFTRLYLHFFPQPDLASIAGGLYVLSMLLTSVAVSVALKTLWSRLPVRARARV